MKTEQVRQLFLNYFGERGHTVVAGSSLIPHDDPTLLFTNAGMVQFKKAFLDVEQWPYKRAASSQPCLRAGGKHNDLENVGYTARHHTFFEMLGNFSFGDYFKRDAIELAWEFLTKILKLPPARLWVTVFEKDKEAEDLWLQEVGIDPKRFSRCGEKDNFWSMGDTGPCGPCTEIYYDHGPHVAGGPPGSTEEGGDRYVEIWNLVFMQYNRDENGNLNPLPKQSVDTGMGLERIAAVMQGVHSNYDIDIFKHLIKFIVELGNISDVKNQSLRVIADHIRACAFLIMEDVLPSNEGRGYVLRRIARRAIRHGYRLGFTEPFFYQMVAPLVIEMGEAYPDLQSKKIDIERVLHQEELQFARTLEHGLKILEQDIENLAGNLIPGETVFRLYDTYGFPVDLTADIAREKGLTLDMNGFKAAMEVQRERARGASQFTAPHAERITSVEKTNFIGYEHLTETAEIVALYKDGSAVVALLPGEEGAIVLNHTPFYAEAGGQVGDQGELSFMGGLFEIQDTRKLSEAYVHYGIVKQGTFKLGMTVSATVDKEKRLATALNHSATHLLHAALRKIIGSHVQQKGSLVEPQRLRFDFSHFEPLSSMQLHQIERLVNEKIQENSMVTTTIQSVEEAMSAGAIALFGEKYGKAVRVLQMGGNFSVELCGGTHVRQTGDIGLFKITDEYGISTGVRRLEAVTGLKALDWLESREHALNRAAALLKCSPEGVEEKVQQLMAKNRQYEKDIQQLRMSMFSSSQTDLAKKARKIKGIHVLAAKLPVGDVKLLRETVDRLKHQLAIAVVVLGGVAEGNKIHLIAGVTPNCTHRIKAVDVVNEVAHKVGGQGGGRWDMAQAGGNQPEHLEEALDSVYSWIEEQLKHV